MNYASFLQRLLGGLIDLIITFPISWIGYKLQMGQTDVLLQILFMIFNGFYFIIFWVIKSATPGMMLMKIKLVTDNKSLTIWRAGIRYIGMNISMACLFLGCLWMLWDKKRQTWQDKMAKTYVIKVK
jgi:uncharacterized RDD family membrane protein YckC